MRRLIYSQDFLGYFFGTNDYALVAVCFIYGCVGMMMMMLVDVMGRDKTSDLYSPKEFKLSFFMKDNAPRFLFNFLIMLVAIRFYSDFMHEPTTPKESVLIGFFSDVIALLVKKRKQKAYTDAENGKFDRYSISEVKNNNGEESSTKKEVIVQSQNQNS